MFLVVVRQEGDLATDETRMKTRIKGGRKIKEQFILSRLRFRVFE